MKRVFIIESQSGMSHRMCLLGEGATEKAAWEDAYGPKPWTAYVKKSAKNAQCREVTEDELFELRDQS
jgi:hypothetical protein